MNMPARKKRYHNLQGFIKDCLYLFPRIKHIKYAWLIALSVISPATKNKNHSKESSLKISSQFRERLLLAVTSVNECTACSYLHTKAALKEGVDLNEINQILDGNLSTCPEEEITALLYAQHWAEVDGVVDHDAKEAFQQCYGQDRASAIEFCLGTIRIGNLLGNTLEHFVQVFKANRKP